MGRLETPLLDELRLRVAALPACGFRCARADVRVMQADEANGKSLFQAASQFNLLEMTSYTVSPEDGVTR